MLVLAACSGKAPGTPQLTRAQLLDPASCQSCHPTHHADWAASMHAQASEDPVFRALNARGQRATDGGLGSFCISCHAPMAVREGKSTDGLNLDQVPQALHGVTCYFCHAVDAVEGQHNNPLHLSDDGVMRGAFADPIAGTPHGAAASPLHDRDQLASASTCGACHDIVTGHGAAIERTFTEWQASAFGHAPAGTTCGQCHMPESRTPEAIAVFSGAPLRRAHSHAMPAVDLALPPLAESAAQRQQVEAFLATTLQSALCVESFGNQAKLSVLLDNVAGGHGFPSGSAQDRRAWVEVHAYAQGQELFSSGAVPDGGAVTALADPSLWLLRDCMFDTAQQPTELFWEAASTRGNTLPALATFDEADPRFYQTHLQQTYPATGLVAGLPDRVEAQVWLQPIGVDFLDDLVATGDLLPGVRAAMQTLPVGPRLVWTADAATATYFDAATQQEVRCVSPSGLNVAADKVKAVRRACGP